MKYLLDVHIGLHISRSLESGGHDVLRAALHDRTASDLDLINLAIAQKRVLITEDSDFTDLIFAHGHAAPPALIYVRCEPFEQSEIAELVLEVVDGANLIGQVAVVTTKQVRYRPFPKGIA